MFSGEGASNEYQQHMFLWRNKKKINTFGLKKHLIKSYDCIKGVPIIHTVPNDMYTLQKISSV